MSAATSSETVLVDTEHGSSCVVDFERSSNGFDRTWTVQISDDLIRQAPEAIVAALTMAVRQLPAWEQHTE